MFIFTPSGLPSGVATGSLLISNGVGASPIYSASPTITTSLTVPSLYGSATSGGSLTLASTAHATKGNILFGNSAYDEVNNRLVIGGTTSVGYGITLITASSADGMSFKQGSTAHSILNAFTNSAGTDMVYIGMAGFGNGVITGSVKGDLCFRSVANSMLFSGNNGTASCLTISPSNVVFVGPGTTAISTEPLCVTQNTTGALQSSIYNPNTTAGSSSQLVIGSGSTRGYIFCYGQNQATSGYGTASMLGIDGSGVGGLALAASNASGTIRFFPGGTTERARFTAAGLFGIGLTPTKGYFEIAGGTTTLAAITLTTGTNKTTPVAGDIEYNGTSLFFTNGGAQRQEIPLIQQSRVSTQFDKTTSTTLANITGLTSTLVAGKNYYFEAILHVTSDAIGGLKVAIAGTCTATTIIYQIEAISDTSNALAISARQTALAGSSGVALDTAYYVYITGLITVNTGGTLTAQFAQNASNGTSSIIVGSTFMTREII